MNPNRLSRFPLAAFAALVCLPLFSSAQSILQTAGNFTLLGATAVTNNGGGATTIINGNVGSAAAVTGFNDSNNDFPGNPGIVTAPSEIFAPGTTAFIGSPSAVNTALNDAGTAHTGLLNMATSLGDNLTGDNLGALGGPVTPGVFTDNDAAALLNGTLVLNFQNKSNVAFVFQFGTALNITLGSIIQTENTGSNDGIFFVAGTSSITVGNNVSLVGNYLSGTAITFGTGDTFDGRALALTAGVTYAGQPTGTINPLGEPGGGDYTGGLVLNGTTVVASAIPEPAALLWLAPLGVMGFVLWRRRSPASPEVVCDVPDALARIVPSTVIGSFSFSSRHSLGDGGSAFSAG
jgi:hypothetical protein